jgi:hypothetical protein
LWAVVFDRSEKWGSTQKDLNWLSKDMLIEGTVNDYGFIIFE